MFHKFSGSASQMFSLDYCSALCTASLLAPNQLLSNPVSAFPVSFGKCDGLLSSGLPVLSQPLRPPKQDLNYVSSIICFGLWMVQKLTPLGPSQPRLSFTSSLSSEVSVCLMAKPIWVRAGWGFPSSWRVCHKWKVPKLKTGHLLQIPECHNLSRHSLTGQSTIKNRSLRRGKYKELVLLSSSVIFGQCL